MVTSIKTLNGNELCLMHNYISEAIADLERHLDNPTAYGRRREIYSRVFDVHHNLNMPHDAVMICVDLAEGSGVDGRKAGYLLDELRRQVLSLRS